jgi:copper oxidase (laccase) domain-containing protein
VDGIRAAGVPEAAFVRRSGLGARPHVDLRAAVAAQLRAAGVEVVDVCVACTATDPELWSHRRDGAARGSLAGLIGRRAL